MKNELAGVGAGCFAQKAAQYQLDKCVKESCIRPHGECFCYKASFEE